MDAYTEPVIQKGWPPDNQFETHAEYYEHLRNTPTFAACDILATTNGDLRFILTAMANMNCPCMMTVNSQVNQNTRF
jgi:hypothetical protein